MVLTPAVVLKSNLNFYFFLKKEVMGVKQKKVLIWAVLILLLAFAASGCGSSKEPASEEEVVRIAVVGPMAFIQGEQHWMGAEMAAEEINEAGGIKAVSYTHLTLPTKRIV